MFRGETGKFTVVQKLVQIVLSILDHKKKKLKKNLKMMSILNCSCNLP